MMAKRKVKPLTAFETRLRRNQFMRAIGHNPAAPNCHWADEFATGTQFCKPCDKLNRMLGPQVFGKFRPIRRW